MKHPWRILLLGLPLLGVLAAPSAGAPLSLLGDRFRVEASWRTAAGQTGVGTPVSLTGETGYFWFFSPTNVEVVVKVLDACAGTVPRFWVFAGGLTDVFVTLEVTDNATGEKKTYQNPQGTPYRPVQDTNAFATCGVERCGQGTFEELAATPRADIYHEALALLFEDGLTVSEATYRRVLADVGAIRQMDPEVAGVGFHPYVSPKYLVLTFDEATAPSVVAGTYRAWDCLNAWYGVNYFSSLDRNHQMSLGHDKVLDMRRVALDYRSLPGVTAAEVATHEPFPITTPPPQVDSFCGRAEGNVFHYYVRRGGIYSKYFSSLPGSDPVPAASVPGLPVPWFEEAEACFAEHVASLPV